MRWRVAVFVVVGAAALAVAAPYAFVGGSATAAGQSSPPPGKMTAVIQRTTDGVPHIVAHDWASLGFGYGYAFAQDNLCVMANDYITVEGQRSRYFGPKASYEEVLSGVSVSNLDSDLFYRQIIASGAVQRMVRGLSPAEQRLEAGYVAGYNKYLASVGGSAGITDPTCRGQAWVKPITLLDSYMRLYQVIMSDSSDLAIPGITQAAPPAGGAVKLTSDVSPVAAGAEPSRGASAATARLLSRTWPLDKTGEGSNAIALGSAGTQNHLGMLLGNPHVPWVGPDKFYQVQMTIPGTLDVTGAALYGLPFLIVGHTMSMAWSLTVSTAFRFTPYQLTLVPGHPTEYLQDGHPTAMTSRKVTVMVKQPDGSLAPYSRTLWSTRYGPVLDTLPFRIAKLPWSTTTAFAYHDADASDLTRAFNTWFHINQASSTGQVLGILKKYQGIPFTNTVVTDRAGQALYADIGNIPDVSDAEAKACATPLGAKIFQAVGFPILNGSKTSCDWARNSGAAAPGIFPPSQEPSLLTDTYVTNSNDSYWLSNAQHPLTGFARIIGTEGTARTLRTRIGLLQTEQRVAGTDGQGKPGFTLPQLRHELMSDDSYAAQLTLPALVKMCDTFQAHGGEAPLPHGGKVSLGDACATLARWNGRFNPSQRGAVLFDYFWQYANTATPSPFSHPFELSNPVTTPYGLDRSSKEVRDSLGEAIAQLDKFHVPLDTPLSAVQFVSAGKTEIPIPGGPGDPTGILNSIDTSLLNFTGTPTPPGSTPTAPAVGSSFIQLVTWHQGQVCPTGQTILTYSESSNPDSPYFADQTKLFSQRKWLPDTFCQSQIVSNSDLRVTTVTSG